jgi:Cu+-exporting ATPase
LVHSLLTENGLGHFYDLNRHPGIRVAKPAPSAQWVYLDDPEVRARLVDFSDGRTTRLTLRIPSIHCVACVWLLENLFNLHPGIGRSRVNYARREVSISFADDRIRLSELVALLVSIGYEPSLTLGELERAQPDPARRRRQLQTGIAGFAFGNIMLFSLPLYLGLDSLSGPLFRKVFGLLSLALGVPVLVYSAADFWRSALLSFRQRILTLDVPIILGLIALYAQSAFEILSGRGEGYLDSMAGLVFLLLCGRLFQQKTFDRLTFDRDYRCFFPLSVQRRTAGGEESVALSSLRVGDRLILRHGELIPADARLVEGAATIDYSFVTGEAQPVERRVGDRLYAGGRQVGGAITIETIKPVSQSYLTALWNDEAFQKPRGDDLNSLTNRYSRRFTVLVIGIALATLAAWAGAGQVARGIHAFTSVLIVACPCALALAAPFALGTAQRLLARSGVFLRNTLVLERLAQVDTIVLDKTGTLTTAPRQGVSFHGNPLAEVEVRWVCALAHHSTHPHALRLAEALGSGPALESVAGFAETAGRGIAGRVAGHDLRLGSAAWLTDLGLSVPSPAGAPAASDAGEQTGPGPDADVPAPGAVSVTGPSAADLPPGSAVWVAIDGRVRGAFVLANVLRPGVDAMVERLGGQYRLALLSGDRPQEQARFRRLFGAAASIQFERTPLDKLAYIRSLQNQGRRVLMVGDGLNDAGALRQSDVGVAVVERVGAFSPASDAIVSGERVAQLGAVLGYARRASRVVRLSFALSAVYNAVGVAVAAAGWFSPLICAVLMPLSSASVILFASGAAHRAGRRAGFAWAAEPSSTPLPVTR